MDDEKIILDELRRLAEARTASLKLLGDQWPDGVAEFVLALERLRTKGLVTLCGEVVTVTDKGLAAIASMKNDAE